MQYLVILSVTIVLLIALGVSLQMIANISAWGILLVCVALSFLMTGFFAVYLARMICGKRTKGVYLRADTKGTGRLSKYKSAVYDIDGEEHYGIFPADIRAFYRAEKECRLLVDKKGFVYDRVIRITIIAGTILSAFSTAGLIVMMAGFMNYR